MRLCICAYGIMHVCVYVRMGLCTYVCMSECGAYVCVFVSVPDAVYRV